MSVCLVKQNDGTWVENINAFYSTFTNVFFIFVTFFKRFLTFFFWNVFYIYDLCALFCAVRRGRSI